MASAAVDFQNMVRAWTAKKGDWEDSPKSVGQAERRAIIYPRTLNLSVRRGQLSQLLWPFRDQQQWQIASQARSSPQAPVSYLTETAPGPLAVATLPPFFSLLIPIPSVVKSAIFIFQYWGSGPDSGVLAEWYADGNWNIAVTVSAYL